MGKDAWSVSMLAGSETARLWSIHFSRIESDFISSNCANVKNTFKNKIKNTFLMPFSVLYVWVYVFQKDASIVDARRITDAQ